MVGHWNRRALLALASIVTAGVLSVSAAPAMAAPTACTMTSSKGTVFKTATQSIHIENALSTDLTATEVLVLRSLTGSADFFRLQTLTTASCKKGTAPPEEGGATDNTFVGQGTGSFGPDSAHTATGYTITFEIGDDGDGTSTESTTADLVSFKVSDSHGTVVWQGGPLAHLTSGMEELAEGSNKPPPPGSCEPSSSLSVLVQGKNVTSYVPKGNWEGGATGISAVNVEGSSITPTLIPTPNAVNSAASNPTTGETVATSNGTDVYTIVGTTLTHTLTDSGSGNMIFSGGFPTTGGVAMDAVHNRALLGLSLTGGPGFQFLDLASNTFSPGFVSPSGEISEDPLIDPSRNLLLSAAENNNYEIANISNPSSPAFFENPIGGPGEADSSGEDCTTGIALAPYEGADPSQVFVTDLTQAKFTAGSPGTWTAPSQIQTLTESSLSAGASGIAVAQGTHSGVVAGEFGGNEITAFTLPATSGTGTPAITDWVSCTIGNTPDSNVWNEGFDPHTLTSYQSPNSSDAIGLFANDEANWLARVDLTQLLGAPRDAAGHLCASGTIPSSMESFIAVP